MRSPPRSSLWFFFILALAGVCAIVTPFIFNLHQLLQPEQLEAARQRWRVNGPRDYDLLYQQKENDQTRPDEFKVIVRDGKVWEVYVNRDVLMANEQALPLAAAIGPAIAAITSDRVPQHELTGYTVEGLFQTIEKNLRKNAEAGSRNFATASFDSRDGHPTRYVYRDKSKSERLEWNIRLLRP